MATKKPAVKSKAANVAPAKRSTQATFADRLHASRPSVTRRYFRVTEGPVMDVIVATHEKNKATRKAWTAFLREVGGNPNKGYANSSLKGFAAKKSPGIGWRRSFDATDLYVPNGKTKEGRSLAARMRNLPSLLPYQHGLEAFQIYDHPLLMDGNKWYRPQVAGTPGKCVYVTVPWREYSPELVAEYLKQSGKKGGFTSGEMDFISAWQPAPGMVEVKEWEMLRDMEKQP